MKSFIELEGVSKIYSLANNQELYALQNVTLSVHEGEILGLLGVNGAGKTTLSSILATLHPPTTGDVLFEGASIYQKLIEYRKLIGFCPQRPNVNPYLTLQQGLHFAGDFYGLLPAVTAERVFSLMRDFDLDKYASQKIYSLSGGYRQRFMLARALVHQPRLIVLDEPTVALDVPVRRYLWDVIRRLKHEGVTILLTTHYLEEAEALADRVCLLHKGKILHIDSPDNLKKKFAANDLESVFMALLDEVSHV